MQVSSYQINVTRNAKLTRGNVIKFHFSLTKYTGIPLLTRRQAISGKYEKKRDYYQGYRVHPEYDQWRIEYNVNE